MFKKANIDNSGFNTAALNRIQRSTFLFSLWHLLMVQTAG